MARRCPSSCSSAIFGGARNGAASKEGLCSNVQDFPHWNKKPVQIIPWRAQETQLRDTNFVFGTHINFQEPSQHETSVSATVIKCFVFFFFFSFLVRLRAEFWLVLREVSIVLFGLLGIFAICDWSKRYLATFLTNQKYCEKQPWLVHVRVPLLNPTSCFRLELWLVHFNGCLHSDWLV